MQVRGYRVVLRIATCCVPIVAAVILYLLAFGPWLYIVNVVDADSVTIDIADRCFEPARRFLAAAPKPISRVYDRYLGYWLSLARGPDVAGTSNCS